MAGAPVVVIARWDTTEDAVDEVLAHVETLVSASRSEPGCLGYEVFRDADAAALVLVERYRDQAAVEAHRDSRHYRELVTARVLPLLTGRRVEIVRPV